jgi:hypothetical protein
MAQMVQFGNNIVEAIDQFIAENVEFEAQVDAGLALLVEAYAHTVTGFAQKRSKGLNDPLQAFPELAWLIPVRRITGNYYSGWSDRQMGEKTWLVTNTSREAYFIEFGINHPNTGKKVGDTRVRIRRPVLKLSVQDAIEFYDGMGTMSRLVGDRWAMASAGSPALIGNNLYGQATIGVRPLAGDTGYSPGQTFIQGMNPVDNDAAAVSSAASDASSVADDLLSDI